MITIIPAIDIIDRKCVRLTKGDYTTACIYNSNPIDVARSLEDVGCKRLHVVDLDGAKSSHIVNYDVLENIASHTNLIIDFGGGIKSAEDVKIAFESGASMITGGSIAVKNRVMFLSWLEKFGADRIILGADARDGRISTSGWIDDSDEKIIDFITAFYAEGVKKVISTDINVDGTFSGPSIPLYKDILSAIPELYLIASGGVGSMDDIYALNDIAVPEVIVGKALYEGRISLHELESFNSKYS